MNKSDTFKFVLPAQLTKAEDGSWKVRGLASNEIKDQQGETIIQKGVDLTPIDQKKGILNWDHNKGPENTIGLLDGYSRGENGLYIEGRLFKNHTKAIAVKEIMDSLDEGDQGRMGLSVEGQIVERDKNDHSIIKKCKINAVALTMNPVNTGTYADLVKSMNAAECIEFNSEETNISENYDGEVTFTTTQVMEMVKKALGIGAGSLAAPDTRTGGDALVVEDLDQDKKKKKKLKKMTKDMYKSNMLNVLGKLKVLYPGATTSELWEAVKERMETTFPDIKESFGKAGMRINIKQQDPKEREHKLYEEARQRSDYGENQGKNRKQLAELARESGAGKRAKDQIRAQADAAIQEGEDRSHVRPGVGV